MDEIREIRLNGEVISRARIAQKLSQRGLARIGHLRLAQLVALENSGRCERLSLGALFKLAEALCVEPGSLLQRQAEARPPEKDDVTVEAMLAMVGKAVNRDDIAWALEWEIERVNHALLALEARLLGTGQRLRRAKFGWFGLAPTEDTLAPEEAQNIGRATCTEYGINLSQARTLYKVAHGERLHQNHTRGRSDRLYNPISILLRAGLLGQEESGIALSAEVAYSLCFEDVRTAQPRPLKPQTRRLRAGYCVDHREKKEAGA